MNKNLHSHFCPCYLLEKYLLIHYTGINIVTGLLLIINTGVTSQTFGFLFQQVATCAGLVDLASQFLGLFDCVVHRHLRFVLFDGVVQTQVKLMIHAPQRTVDDCRSKRGAFHDLGIAVRDHVAFASCDVVAWNSLENHLRECRADFFTGLTTSVA